MLNEQNKPTLKIISFSGEEGATKNMSVYECGDEIIIVDVGVEFADDTLPGVDVVIPDFTYILENQHKVKGIIITHAHEDHIGAVPYLLREANFPIYGTQIVQEFLKLRIEDKAGEEVLKNVSFHLVEKKKPPIQIGTHFKLSAFGVNHSVPDTVGLCIETPQGKILHIADHKIDLTPVTDDPIDFVSIAKHGDSGVLCLLSDCLGANHEGHSISENTMNHVFHELLDDAQDRQVMITLISSSISRMQQIMEATLRSGRKIVLGGYSIDKSVQIGRKLGYLNYDDNFFVDERTASGMPQKDLVYLVAGCFGQTTSTLYKVSKNEHRTIKLEDNAMVIFSAEPSPPGSRIPVERLMDQLTLAGAEVIYHKIQQNLHVSGHGPKGDLSTVASMVNPKYFIPIGGSVTQSRAYTNMVVEMGYPRENVFELREGESVVFENGTGIKSEEVIQTNDVLVDGSKMKQVGEIVIKDRGKLGSDGVFVVVVPISKDNKQIIGKVEVITRGFVYVKESKQLMGTTKDRINKIIDKNSNQDTNWSELQNTIERDISRYLFDETGRKPMVIVHSILV